jgi:hypothetical protein
VPESGLVAFVVANTAALDRVPSMPRFGVAVVMRRKDQSLSLLLWLIAPFAVFSLRPFDAPFFDIRYLMGALPAFFLLVAVGIFGMAFLTQQILASFAPRLASARFRNGLVRLMTAAMVALSVHTYSLFRLNTRRCSTFTANPGLLEENNGFCGRYLILNSLYAGHAFILKPVDRPQ